MVAQTILLAVMLQTGFTTSLHIREMAEASVIPSSQSPPLALAAAAGALASGALIAVHLTSPDATFDFGALIYRSFVFIIGGVFSLAFSVLLLIDLFTIPSQIRKREEQASGAAVHQNAAPSNQQTAA